MKIKTLILAALLSLGFPLAVKAEAVEEQKHLSFCDTECDRLNVSQTNNFPIEVNSEDEVAQRTRPRRVRTRRRASDFRKFYVGGTLGAFFPSTFEDFPEIDNDGEGEDIDFDTGFGGSIYGGYKFSKFIGADLEFLLFGGGAEPFDSNYGSFGIFLNPRFTYGFNLDNLDRSPYIFVSPGLGIAGVGFSDDLEDTLDDNDIDTSASGFALQIKAGVGYPFSELIDIFTQVRYFTAFNVYSEDDIPDQFDGDDQSFNSLGLELGINFKF